MVVGRKDGILPGLVGWERYRTALEIMLRIARRLYRLLLQLSMYGTRGRWEKTQTIPWFSLPGMRDRLSLGDWLYKWEYPAENSTQSTRTFSGWEGGRKGRKEERVQYSKTRRAALDHGAA